MTTKKNAALPAVLGDTLQIHRAMIDELNKVAVSLTNRVDDLNNQISRVNDDLHKTNKYASEAGLAIQRNNGSLATLESKVNRLGQCIDTLTLDNFKPLRDRTEKLELRIHKLENATITPPPVCDKVRVPVTFTAVVLFNGGSIAARTGFGSAEKAMVWFNGYRRRAVERNHHQPSQYTCNIVQEIE